MDTVFVRGSGGAIFEMDVPAEGTSKRELYDEKIANGELTVVPVAEWVDVMGPDKDGKSIVVARVLQAAAADETPEPAVEDRGPTKADLVEKAKTLGILGAAQMNKAQLAEAVDAAEAVPADAADE